MSEFNPDEAPQTVERHASPAVLRPAQRHSDRLPFSVIVLLAIQVAAALLTILFANLYSSAGPWSESFITAALVFGLLYLLLTLGMIVIMILLRSSHLLGYQLIIFIALFLLANSIEAWRGRI